MPHLARFAPNNPKAGRKRGRVFRMALLLMIGLPAAANAAEVLNGLPGWREDDQAKVLPALMQTCDWAETQTTSRYLGSRREAGKVADWLRVCAAARKLPANDSQAVRRFFESHFKPVELADGREGHLSAYHSPIVKGSRTRTSRYNVPIYRLPTGSSAPASRSPVLVWVNSRSAAASLAMEGSGRVIMTDGSVVELDYAGQGGDVVPGSRRSKSRGEQDEARAEGGSSRVYFRVRNNEGATGAAGMELTPGRSVAVDPRFVPLGPPVWVEMRHRKNDQPTGDVPSRLAVAQDTGARIRGPARADLFVGQGPAAAQAAENLSTKAKLTMLVPRTAPVQVAEVGQ